MKVEEQSVSITQSVKSNPAARFLRQTRTILEMIKIEHTVFALPFALMATVIAVHGHWPLFWHKLPWILLAMVGARSAAMAFNRIVDRHYDAANPRTANRAIPAGILTVPQVAIFTIVSCLTLVAAAAMLNPLAFLLSPVALLLALGYSYTKRFTVLSHLFLGLALSVAPAGAWIAVTGRLDPPAMFLAGSVIFWLFGFDILYALQDTDFDVAHGLRSIPAWVGNARALTISRLGHVVMVGLLIATGLSAHLGGLFYIGVVVTAALIVYEQSLVRPNDLSKLNLAFFTLNGYISVGLFLFTLFDIMFERGRFP